MPSPEPTETACPAPAMVTQGIGPLFTPPYIYAMFPVVVIAAVIVVPLLPVGGQGGPFALLLPLLIIIAVGCAFAIGSLWPMRLVVGNDGVLLSWLFLRRFISYRDLASVEVHRSARSRGLLFVTRKGHQLAFPQQVHIVTLGVGSENLKPIEELLDRIGKMAIPIAQRVNEGEVSATDDLSVVEDSGAPSESRVAAAARLGELDDSVRRRVRAQLEASADPSFKRVLGAIVGTD